MNHYQQNRLGSARFATSEEMRAAGLTKPQGFYLGQNEDRQHCYSQQQSSVLLVAGARGYKGSNIIPSALKGFRSRADANNSPHVISLDFKNQNGPITELQPDTHVITWSPRNPRHRINPTSYLHIDSPTLSPDSKLFSHNWVIKNGSKEGEFFQASAQSKVEQCSLGYVEQFGVLDLPVFADVMALFATETDLWKEFEFFMSESRFASVRAMAEELREIRHSDNPNAGGLAGVKGEIANSFACLSDADLRASISPPFDFDPADLVIPNGPRFQLNLAESMEFAVSSAPVIRAILTSVLIHKRRALASRNQVWLLDEIGNIGAWPLAVEMATYGPGFGIRPVYVVQSIAQLDNLGPRAGLIIPNSCGTQIYRAVRDPREAKRIAEMLGDMTLEVEDVALNERALMAQRQALDAMLFDGADPFTTGRDMALQDEMAAHTNKMRRPLMTADEIMNQHEDAALAFMPGALPAPMRLRVPKYWTRKDLRGRYLGDPFHDDPGTVSIAGRFGGSRKARVISEPVPSKLAHLPQYADRPFQYVKGNKPKF